MRQLMKLKETRASCQCPTIKRTLGANLLPLSTCSFFLSVCTSRPEKCWWPHKTRDRYHLVFFFFVFLVLRRTITDGTWLNMKNCSMRPKTFRSPVLPIIKNSLTDKTSHIFFAKFFEIKIVFIRFDNCQDLNMARMLVFLSLSIIKLSIHQFSLRNRSGISLHLEQEIVVLDGLKTFW